jgi:hypothetical protein
LLYYKLYKGNKVLEKKEESIKKEGFTYGDLGSLPVFKGKHPKVIETYLKELSGN